MPKLADNEIPQTEASWKEILTPEEFAILRQAKTETPFSGEYIQHGAEGIFVCRACGNQLFNSETKYRSGCGWPAFYDVVAPDAIKEVRDESYGMIRTEIRCARCDSHLGHVFEVGNTQTGLWYCINSRALDFQSAS
jgi:peptide-methionine (R)-S-oxide reductase